MTMFSIERRLLAWVLGALSLSALCLVVVSYVVTLDEMDEVFNDNLKQVALAVASYHTVKPGNPPALFGEPGAGLSETAEPSFKMPRLPAMPTHYDNEGDFDFVTATWSPTGERTFTSDPTIDIPFTAHTGLAQIESGGSGWFVYTIVTDRGVAQAAQRVSSRHSLALESTSKISLPMLALVPLVGGLLVFALRRGLRPLDLAAESVAARSAMSLDPISQANMPREIHPLIGSLNDLMQRLSVAFSTQRRFVADAAHELRTPATALRLQLQLLERAQDEATREAAMSQLKSGVNRSQHLIEQLLLLSRMEPDAAVQLREPVDVREVVRQSVGAHSITAEHFGIDLGADLAPTPLMVEGNRQQLLVLVNNLVGNALRYTPRGGLVDVRATMSDEGVVLQVIDNGPGIDVSERERVFDRFYRGRAATHLERRAEADQDSDHITGSGLGLAIVKAIAQQHDAVVSLHPGPSGSGLEARVVLHASSLGVRHPLPAASAASTAPRSADGAPASPTLQAPA
jgi:signal transduction histidine kinase